MGLSGLIVPGDKDFSIGPDEINRMHDYDDVDVGPNSHHHTLGGNNNQAASGTHKHYKDQTKFVLPALQNGWAAYAAPWTFQGYTKNAAGWVSFAGLILGGTVTSGTLIFTLPVGYRPGGDLHVVCPTGTAPYVCLVNIFKDGTVKCNTAVTAAWLGFDGIGFQAFN